VLAPGHTLSLVIEKPAAGGRMIARTDGRVVLVAGAIPGERVTVRLTRVGKGVAYADTVSVEEASADRLLASTDPRCGGCAYAHIAYPRQVEIKSLIIADAFARIARIPLPARVAVAPSPVAGYRMRARLHYRDGRLGWFLEGTHELCDVGPTAQLLPATTAMIGRLAQALALSAPGAQGDIDVTENVDGSERVVHLHMRVAAETQWLAAVGDLTGVTADEPSGVMALAGRPYVTDILGAADPRPIALRRHVLAFFQGNRFLLEDFVVHVVGHVPAGARTIDLYAGGGLFALAAARRSGVETIAVEGERLAAEDLAVNVAAAGGGVTAVHQSVERFVRTTRAVADVVIVDPPRTGLSTEALDGVVRLGPERLIYVSCDVATLARDARRLLDAGYRLGPVTAFDLFPVTPHVETVVIFEK
jgi:23S rRNA (uracil1939-C5)-methyltransferase